jgi:hypothetical protein
VSILLGNGDGTFQPQVAYTGNIGTSPYPVAVGDFDGDGTHDLAIANYGDLTASVLLGVQAESLVVNNVIVSGAGTHNVLASYPGDTAYAPSQSTTVPLTGLLATTTVLTSSAKSVPSGQPLTFTATVSSTGGIPTGSVNFYDSTTLLGTATLDANGVALFTATLSAGSHTITATYTGDTKFNRSTSAPITVTITVATTTVLTSSAQSVPSGQPLTFTATVSSAGGIPTGSVNFYDSTTLLGTATLNAGGVAAFTATLSVGAHTITATYTGDTNFNRSTSAPITVTITVATTTVLTSSAQSVPSGQPLTFTATVSSTSGVPTGSVNFYDASTLLGTATLNAGGVAAFTDTLSVGSHTITAAYTGDTNFNRSTSAPVTVTITVAAATDFVVGSATQTQMVNPGGKVSFPIVVVSVKGSYNSPVALTVTGLPVGGTATFTPPSLTPGDNSATSILAIQMPSTVSFLAPGPQPPNPLWPLQLATLAAALALLGLNQRVKPLLQFRPVAVRVIGLLLFAVVIAGVSGCSGGFIASTPRSFAITVTGTSGSQQHSTTVILNVR